MNTYFMVKFAKPSKQLIRTTNRQGKKGKPDKGI